MNEVMKDALVCMQDCMMNNNVHGNFTKEENLHLTLAFIGGYPDPDTILEVMDASDYRPVKLSLDGIGHYNEVWYAGLADNKGLQAYVKRLRHCLADAGIPFDRKKFSPHITLIRKPQYHELSDMTDIVIPKISMIADHVSLMRSDRGKNGMIYTEIR